MTTTNREQSWGWDQARKAQLQAARRMTPAQRLAWLEDYNRQLRALLGRARQRADHRPVETR
jgi:hypothetical protein